MDIYRNKAIQCFESMQVWNLKWAFSLSASKIIRLLVFNRSGDKFSFTFTKSQNVSFESGF